MKKKLRKLWFKFRNLFPAYCAGCKGEMKYLDKINLASVDQIGVYYRADGICMKCCSKHMYKAFDDAATEEAIKESNDE